MLAAERHRRIADALRSSRVVATEDLANLLGVSPETTRRDLATLERRGALRRVHGGATALNEPLGEEAPFAQRSDTYGKARKKIAHTAISLIEPGQTLVLDVGTTALDVARHLPAHFHGTVATCSLLVATELADRPGVDVLVAGGRVRGGDLTCGGHLAARFFEDFNADIAFLGSGGVSAGAGLTDFHVDEIATRRTIIRNSARSYALAVSAKLGRVAPHRVCEIAELDAVITDREPHAQSMAEFISAGATLLAARSDHSAVRSAHALQNERAST